MSKYSLKKKKYDISEQVALDQVMGFLETYDIDIDAIENKKGKAGVESSLNKLVNYVRSGLVEIVKKDGKITITQNLSIPKGEIKTLVYNSIQGKNKIEMDGYEDTEKYTMVYELVGSLCGIGSEGIKKLEGKDLSVAEVLGAIFLQI